MRRRPLGGLWRALRGRGAGRWTLGPALLASVACGAPEGEPSGLRFEALAPVPESELAPLERYPARDGASLPVRHYPAAGAELSLLLVHGSGSHSRYLAPLARRVAASGAARVYTPDLRGHGLDPKRRGDCDAIDQLQDDLADLAREVRSRHPGTRIAVGGHSSGGGLAVRFAGSDYRDQASGYLLLAPYLGHDAPTAREGSGGWARPRLPVIIGLSILNGFGVRGLNGLTAITFDMPEAVRDGTETLAYSYRLNTGYAPRDYRSDLADLDVPLLALIGSEDEAFRADRLGPALAEVRARELRAEVLPGIGHLDLPSDPQTAARVIDWLTALP